ncbi:MAG: hypothetical protein II621_09825, partial [Clostridia bacterium]|nr:hypothetical protein [Clostridia bacterium]
SFVPAVLSSLIVRNRLTAQRPGMTPFPRAGEAGGQQKRACAARRQRDQKGQSEGCYGLHLFRLLKRFRAVFSYTAVFFSYDTIRFSRPSCAAVNNL